MANLRAAKAAAVSEFLVGDSGDTTVTWTDANDASKGFTAYYEAKGGLLQATKPTATYGAGTATVGSASNTDFNYDPAVSVKDKVIKITVDDKGGCTFAWE
jgi:hypothetical protein